MLVIETHGWAVVATPLAARISASSPSFHKDTTSNDIVQDGGGRPGRWSRVVSLTPIDGRHGNLQQMGKNEPTAGPMPAPAPGTHNQRRHLNSDEILATCVGISTLLYSIYAKLLRLMFIPSPSGYIQVLVFLLHEAQVNDIPRRQRGVSTSPGNLRTMGLRRNPWSNAPLFSSVVLEFAALAPPPK